MMVLAGIVVAGGTAGAQTGGPAALLPGASSHDPINIESGKLDYFDKEQKLIYSGNVVAHQGETTLKASILTIFLTKDNKDNKSGSEAPAGGLGGAQGSSSVRRMEVSGPVTVVSKDEVGTGDNGSYDKASNKITLNGNVTLTQGTNIIKGDELVYDMTSGEAHVTSVPGRRISSVFTPGSGTPNGAPGSKSKAAKGAKGAKPAANSQAEQ